MQLFQKMTINTKVPLLLYSALCSEENQNNSERQIEQASRTFAVAECARCLDTRVQNCPDIKILSSWSLPQLES